MGASKATWVIAVVALGSIACERARDPQLSTECVSWIDDVQPVVRQQCGTCHSSERRDGNYDMSTYLGALDVGMDSTPNAIAGAETSMIIVRTDPRTADANHETSAVAIHALLRQWVVDCDLRHRRSLIHEGGILDPASADFHGPLLAASGYDFAGCAKCHGAAFRGGPSESTCRTCHVDGPTDCAVCHTPVREDEAHALHRRFDCETCHVVPTSWDDAGHLDGAPAEVRFTGLATLDDRQPTASNGRCADTYCHGVATPDWRAVRIDACGTCHALPPPTHARDRCETCHQTVVDAAGIIDETLHVDGVVEVGREPGCTGCHVTTTGLHARHLAPRLRLSAAVQCGDCHLVPSDVNDVGHIDSADPAEVFPAVILDSSLAAARGARPSFDSAAQTCADVYCHGPAPQSWAPSPVQQVYCGSCHGLPPDDATHVASMTIRDCAGCHATSVDGFGNVILDGEESEHLNGRVDL